MADANDGGLSGRLLVAAPSLEDPNFFRTVVVVLDHGDEGALAVVLNRPGAAAVADILPQWAPLAELAPPANIFHGGPVAPDAVIALARCTSGCPPGWHEVVGDVGTVDLSVPPDAQPTALDGVRLFSGYAGWAPGQLEAEVEQRAWFVVAADADDAMGSEPDSLWHDVLRRQGGELALLAGYPRLLASN